MKPKRTMLTLVLSAVRGRDVIVELKNGTLLRGTLEKVDRKMKCVFSRFRVSRHVDMLPQSEIFERTLT